jgi:hypothetical protein
LLIAGAEPAYAAPLRDPALLNLGLGCSWQSRCMKQQQRAMKSALAYVQYHRPPNWKIQVCNRNSSRSRNRKDWVGFNNCIRNPLLTRSEGGSRRGG